MVTQHREDRGQCRTRGYEKHGRFRHSPMPGQGDVTQHSHVGTALGLSSLPAPGYFNVVIPDGHPFPTYAHPEDVIQCATATTVEVQEPGNRQPVMAALQGPASVPLTWARRCCLAPADPQRHANTQTIDQGA